MKKFQYYIPTRILFGKGALDGLHKQALPGKKALIVISSGKSTKANGYLARVEEQLEMAGCEHVLFDKILPNPVLRQVLDGGALAKESGCDFVVGLGGGSSMDAAKAIAVMATNPGDYWDYNGGKTGKGLPLVCDPLPIVAITTTAGTGSEADAATVTTKEETNEKCGFINEKLDPAISVVDPDLMMTIPPMLTAYQGFDALFHAVESVINKYENPMGEMFALKAIEYIAKYLPIAVKDGSNEEARSYVALANTLAGFFMMCTSEHSMEHALSAYHHQLPHGAGLIMISQAYHSHFINSGACDGQYIKMAHAMGDHHAKDAGAFMDALVQLQKDCGVDQLKMSDYGIEKADLEKYAVNARESMGRLFACDPVPLTDEDVLKIYQASYR